MKRIINLILITLILSIMVSAVKIDKSNKKFINFRTNDRLIINEWVSQKYDTISPLYISPNNKTFGFYGTKGNSMQYILNMKPTVWYDNIDPEIAFTPQSKVMYKVYKNCTKMQESIVCRGQWIINGNRSEPILAEMSTPVFSKDGKRMGYGGEVSADGSRFESLLVIDGKIISGLYSNIEQPKFNNRYYYSEGIDQKGVKTIITDDPSILAKQELLSKYIQHTSFKRWYQELIIGGELQ